jgi:hypothetical protein
VVRGGSRVWSKTRRCGDMGKVVAQWPYRRRSGRDQAARRARTAEMAAFGHVRSGGTLTARRQCGSDSGVAWLRTVVQSADAFMAWARHEEGEADRWDPAADFILN